jgi:ankyrin repeat protein
MIIYETIYPYFLKKEQDMDKKDNDFQERLVGFLSGAMLEAIIKDDAEVVVELLKLGANPNNIEDREGLTPLHFALTFRSRKTIPILLSHGANVDRRDREGISPFEYATGDDDEGIKSTFINFR